MNRPATPAEGVERLRADLERHQHKCKADPTGGFRTRCIVRQGDNPQSLHVWEGTDGPAVKCHAHGCTRDDVFTALGTPWDQYVVGTNGHHAAVHAKPAKRQLQRAPTLPSAPPTRPLMAPSVAPAATTPPTTTTRPSTPADASAWPVGALPEPAPAQRYGYRFERYYAACDLHGTVRHYQARFTSLTPNGRKVTPWFMAGGPSPNTLWYRAKGDHTRAARVVFAEGPKAADAVARIYHALDVLVVGAWGADWHPTADLLTALVAGRDVVIWPDDDAEGRGLADRLTAACYAAGARRVRVLDVRALDGKTTDSSKRDAADLVADAPDITVRDVEEFADLREPPPHPPPLLIGTEDLPGALARPAVVRGLMHVGDLVALSSAPGVGKTLVAIDLALTLASGLGRWHGLTVGTAETVGNVAYISLEGLHGLKARVRAWEQTYYTTAPAPRLRWFNVRDYPMTMDALGTLARDPQGVGVVIVDTWRGAVGDDSNANKVTINEWLSHIATLQARGITVLVLHHDTKTGNPMSGAQDLEGRADAVLQLTDRQTRAVARRTGVSDDTPVSMQSPDDTLNVLHLKVRKGRDIPTHTPALRLVIESVALEHEPGRPVLDPDDGLPVSSAVVKDAPSRDAMASDPAVKASPLYGWVCDALRTVDEPATWQTLSTTARELSGGQAPTAKNPYWEVLKTLHDAGLVTRVEGSGRGKPLYYTATPRLRIAGLSALRPGVEDPD